MKKLVILISGNGSNMMALLEAARAQKWEQWLGASASLVISNRADAPGLAKARALGVETAVVDHRQFSSRQDFDLALAERIEAERPSLIALAGFMRILSDAFVHRFSDRLVNIHPSLLPSFPGLATHARAIEAGCRITGATVHRVTPELDHGPILGQVAVPILPGDTVEHLAARVLSQEHLLYPRVVAEFLRDAPSPTGS